MLNIEKYTGTFKVQTRGQFHKGILGQTTILNDTFLDKH